MTGTLRCNHNHVHIFWWLDGFEVNREAVGKAENLSLSQMRLDRRLIEVGLSLVGRENLNPVGALRRFRRSKNGHAIRARLLGGTACRIKADDYVVSAITQILRLCMSL